MGERIIVLEKRDFRYLALPDRPAMDLWPEGNWYFEGKLPKDRARVQRFQRRAQSDETARNGRPIPESTIPVCLTTNLITVRAAIQ